MLTGTTSPAPQVQRALLGNQIADAIRRDILLGVIKPGTRMAQQQLCETFGTSRMPVRDALRVLTHEGLLVTDSGQHTIVAPLSRADLMDSFVIEGMLAGMAAERASRAASDEDLASLDTVHQAMISARAAQDESALAELNWSFHRSINRLSGSRKLLAAIKSASLDLPRTYLAQMPEHGDKSIREHEAILEAMRKRRHSAVRKLMSDHIVESGDGLIKFLEEQGLDLS